MHGTTHGLADATRCLGLKCSRRSVAGSAAARGRSRWPARSPATGCNLTMPPVRRSRRGGGPPALRLRVPRGDQRLQWPSRVALPLARGMVTGCRSAAAGRRCRGGHRGARARHRPRRLTVSCRPATAGRLHRGRGRARHDGRSQPARGGGPRRGRPRARPPPRAEQGCCPVRVSSYLHAALRRPRRRGVRPEIRPPTTSWLAGVDGRSSAVRRGARPRGRRCSARSTADVALTLGDPAAGSASGAASCRATRVPDFARGPGSDPPLPEEQGALLSPRYARRPSRPGSRVHEVSRPPWRLASLEKRPAAATRGFPRKRGQRRRAAPRRQSTPAPAAARPG